MSRCIALVSPVVGRGDGQGRVNYEIARALLDAGDRVVVCAGRCDEDLIARGVRWFALPTGPRRPKLLWVLRYNRAVRRLMPRVENAAGPVDLWVGNGVGLDRPHALNIAHFVHSAWAASPWHPGRRLTGPRALSQRWYTGLNARWERRAFGLARRVVAVSDTTADELAEIGVDRGRLVTIHNGIDSAEFTPDPAGARERPGLGLPAGVPLALFAGDLKTNRKNLDTVLQATARVPGLHLAVAGDARHSVYPARSRALGLADRVHFLGFRRDTPRLMAACDFFVMPSRYDTFGLVILEAMASGLPVITSRRTGAAGLVEAHDAGVVLEDQEDAEACAAAMARLAGDADGRRSAGLRAREAAVGQDWSVVAQRYAELIASLGVPGTPTPAAATPEPAGALT